MIGLALLTLGALVIAGCVSRREGDDNHPLYKYGDVKPVIDEKCVPCHGGENPAANYDMSAYVKKNPGGYMGIVGGGRARLTSIWNDPRHLDILDETRRGKILEWAGEGLAYFYASGIHEPGFLDPTLPEFHGQHLAQTGWQLGACRACHGEDYEGGAVKLGFGGETGNCVVCHQESPESCNGGCHGGAENAAPPRMPRGSTGTAGAHQVHLRESAITTNNPSCSALNSCHPDHQVFASPGHVDSIIQVSFTGVAAGGFFDPVLNSCRTYCHGGETTVWNGPAQTCTSCHPESAPHRRHPQIPGSSCSRCHSAVVGVDNRSIRDLSKHINGAGDVGRTGVRAADAGCNDCHFDFDGPFEEGAFEIGAHERHFRTTVTVPPTCDECHTVPWAVFTSGHIDTTLPAEVVFGGDSRANWSDRAAIPYNDATGRCEVRCHSFGSRSQVPPPWYGPYGDGGCFASCHFPLSELHTGMEGTCQACHDILNNDGTIAQVTRHIPRLSR